MAWRKEANSNQGVSHEGKRQTDQKRQIPRCSLGLQAPPWSVEKVRLQGRGPVEKREYFPSRWFFWEGLFLLGA